MQFKVNEIVWGKIKGYPYWPCRILYDIPEKGKCRVAFFGEQQQGELLYSMIKNFESYVDTYNKQYRKEKKLKLAFTEAMENFPHLALEVKKKTIVVGQKQMSGKMLKILKYLEKRQRHIEINRFEELYVLCGKDERMLQRLIIMDKFDHLDEHYIKQQLIEWREQDIKNALVDLDSCSNEYKIFF